MEPSISSKSLKTAVNLFGLLSDILFKVSCTKLTFSSGIHTSPSNKSLCNLHLFKFIKSNFSWRKYNLYISYFPGIPFSPILSSKNWIITFSEFFNNSFCWYISCCNLFISFCNSSLLGIWNWLAPKISQIFFIFPAKYCCAPPWTKIVKIFFSIFCWVNLSSIVKSKKVGKALPLLALKIILFIFISSSALIIPLIKFSSLTS